MHLDMKKFIGNIAFVAVLLIIIARFITIFNGTPFPLNIIASSSMQPSLQKGDIVPWVPCELKDVKEGDVVVYRNIYGNLIIHRVVEIKDNGLITKGDANEYTDQSGPHVPEPVVDNSRLYGKAIMIGKQPLKIPFIGYIWIFVHDVLGRISSHMQWGRPQASFHYLIFLPFIFFFALLLSCIIIWLPNGKSLKEKLNELIFGPEKITLKKTIAYSFSLFIPFLLLSSFFAYDSMEINGGEEILHKSIPVANPSLMPVKGIAFYDGDMECEIDKKIFSINSGERIRINASLNGKGQIFLYSSPYWIVIPDEFMESMYNVNPRLCILFSALLSAILLSFLTVFLLLISSIIVEKYFLSSAYVSFLTLEYHSTFLPLYNFYEKVKKRIGKAKRKMKMIWIDKASKKAWLSSFLAFLFIPLLFDGLRNLFMIAIASSLSISIIAYAIGCRFKNEFAIASLFSSSLFSSVFVARMVFSIKGNYFILLIQFLSVTLILLLILFTVCFLTMLLCASLLHYVREKLDACAMLEVCDI